MSNSRKEVYLSKGGEKIDFGISNSYSEVIAELTRMKDQTNSQEVHVGFNENHLREERVISQWMSIDDAIQIVKRRQCEEQNKKWNQIVDHFTQFNNAICQFKIAGGDESIIASLQLLYSELHEEIMSDKCYGKNEEPSVNALNLNNTHYPVILDHFTKLTKQLTSHPCITKKEIDASQRDLNNKLAGNSLSNKLKAAVLDIFVTLTGIVIGAAVGSLAAGIGAIPGAIMGGSLGFVGGSYLGHLKRKCDRNVAKQKDKPFIFSNEKGRDHSRPREHVENAYRDIRSFIKR